jgi:hypothetical protein
MKLFLMSFVVALMAGAGLFAVATPAQAKPASYYLWMSETDGSRLCTQIPPGDGWRLMGGPYKDGRCTKKAY